MPVQAPPLPSLVQRKNRANLRFKAPDDLISASNIHRTAMDDPQQRQPQVFLGDPVSDLNMHRIVPHGGASPMLPLQGMTLQNLARTYGNVPAMAAGAVDCVHIPTVATKMGGARKRCKESNEMVHAASSAQPQQVHLSQLGVDLNQTLAASFPRQVGTTLVSTGLRLAFDDERSTITSSRPSTAAACGPSLSLGDELAARFTSHQDDLNQLLRTQAEQLRQALEERMRVQAKALMATVEGEVSRKVREKDAEMEMVSRRNAELEERVRQLCMEREVWQSKAHSSEAMVAILRSNLQQAMVQVQHQSREPSRIEGCGDSEADDAASVYIDDNLPAKQSRAMLMRNAMMKSSHMSGSSELVGGGAPVVAAMVRVCRQCCAGEASVLLLPCLHLCVCVQCNQSSAVERCPVCNSLVSNRAEVFLS